MSGQAVPLILLAAALALAAAFAVPRISLAACLAHAAAAGLLALLAVPVGKAAALSTGWLVVLACVAGVLLPRLLRSPVVLALGAASGIAAGLIATNYAQPGDLAMSIPVLALAWPAAWVARRAPLALKVAAGWLLAIALLASALPLVTTPGYVADHAE